MSLNQQTISPLNNPVNKKKVSGAPQALQFVIMEHLIIDSHQDLAWNMLTFGRDYTQPVALTRANEKGTRIPELNKGESMLGWPEFQSGKVCVIFATLFACPIRYEPEPEFTQSYINSQQAHERYSAALNAYRRLVEENPTKFALIKDQDQLNRVVNRWLDKGNATLGEENPIGLVLLMEGAEGIRTIDELEYWWVEGLRYIGPAWAGNQYCGGTDEPGPLTTAGKELLSRMGEIGFTLDISHMDERSVRQAFEIYQGPIIASHANAASLLHCESNRFLKDPIINELISRGGVIGIVPYNHHLVWAWDFPADKHAVKLELVVNQIDYICQLAGDSLHVGIGSDFDGGLGMQSTPSELDTVADLQKLTPLLEVRGYTGQDIDNILFGNWFRQLHKSLP